MIASLSQKFFRWCRVNTRLDRFVFGRGKPLPAGAMLGSPFPVHTAYPLYQRRSAHVPIP